MIHIQTADGVDPPIPNALLEKTVLETLQAVLAETGVEVTILFSTDEEIQKLNRDFLGSDHATDVLSFPGGFINPETNATYLGDIILSVPRLEEQSKQHHQTVEAESVYLVIHGVLHLLGYDHANREEKAQMWAVQDNVFHKLGY